MADFRKLIQNSLSLCLKPEPLESKPCEGLPHPLRENIFDNGYEVAKKPICIGSELHKSRFKMMQINRR